MDSESMFTQSPSTNVIVNHSTTVLLQDLLVFKRDGKVIGKLDATIDFKDLAPELHESAIKLLNRMPTTLYMVSEETANDSKESSLEEEKELESVWQKIKNYFKRD